MSIVKPIDSFLQIHMVFNENKGIALGWKSPSYPTVHYSIARVFFLVCVSDYLLDHLLTVYWDSPVSIRSQKGLATLAGGRKKWSIDGSFCLALFTFSPHSNLKMEIKKSQPRSNL